MQTIEMRCIHQIFRSENFVQFSEVILQQMGKGNCKECTYNPEENLKCSGCYMIPVGTIMVNSKINKEVYMMKNK